MSGISAILALLKGLECVIQAPYKANLNLPKG